MTMDDKLKSFATSLHDVGCLKFGKFILKSGRESSYYVDLRLLISYPTMMADTSFLLNKLIADKQLEFESICGVPYTALPVSTLMSVKMNKPMVLRRKEPKSYGTKQLIEGKFEKGSRCIIVEDIVSTGASILETVADIETSGMVVKDIIVVIDRQEGGVKNVTDRGYNVHCLYTLDQITSILYEQHLIDKEAIKNTETYRNSINDVVESVKVDRAKLPYEKRIEYSKSTAAVRLFTLMADKKTNLCVAADVTDINELLKLATEVGPYICILKVHMDIVEHYSEKERDELKNIAVQHNFLVMEDRKLADIGNTVRMQFNQLSKWANLVTVHSIAGFGVLEAVKTAENYNPDVGVFLIAELSSQNNLINAEYTKKTMALASKYLELVAGVVCQSSATFDDPGLIQLTPGVHLQDNVKSDMLGQQYNGPEEVIVNRGADIAVVGRGIINASKPAEVAKQYMKKLWDAYLLRIQA